MDTNMRAIITKGENKGKAGEIIGMFFGAGICVIKTEDGNEYVAKIDEIQKTYPTIKYTIIGLPKEMVKEIEEREEITIYPFAGIACFLDNNAYRGYSNIECKELFLDTLRKEYGIELPSDYDKITLLYRNEEQHEFNFYIGVMF